MMRFMKFGLVAVVIIGVVVWLTKQPMDEGVGRFTDWVAGAGVGGMVVFGVVYIIGAVALVPGTVLGLAAGGIFGLFWGTVTVSVGSTVAAGVSFLIARYLARGRVQRWAKRYPGFGAIYRAVGDGGWQTIALLRLSPVIPYSVGNYLYGLTTVGFWVYLFTSWLAMLPGTFMYVYWGYAGHAGLAAASGESIERGPGQWAMLVVGLVATVVLTVYLTRLAQNRMRLQAELTQE